MATENKHQRKNLPFKSSPSDIKKYEKYSLKQLNLMWAALPTNNTNKDQIGKEIERRVDAQTSKSGGKIKKAMGIGDAMDVLGL